MKTEKLKPASECNTEAPDWLTPKTDKQKEWAKFVDSTDGFASLLKWFAVEQIQKEEIIAKTNK